MTIQLTKDIFIGGVKQTAGTSLTLSASLEAEIVTNHAGIYTFREDQGIDPVARYHIVDGNVTGLVGPNGNYASIQISNHFPLVKWSAALGKMRNGKRNAKMLLIGDSTMLGSGATGASGFGAGGRSKSMPVKLATEMNRSYEPANAHAWFGDSNVAAGQLTSLASFDTRLTFGAGWTNVAQDGVQLGYRSIFNNTTTNAIDFTPSAAGAASSSVDTFVIWYIQSATSGTFSWAIDAGAATNVIATGASSVQSVTVSAGSLAAHTLHIARVSGSIWILGVQAYDSTTKCVEILNGGANSASASTFTGTAQPWTVLNEIGSIAPDLSIIQIQINDCINSTSIETFKTNLQTIITKCLTTGDVILRSGYPTSISYNAATVLSNQYLYRDAIASVATTNGVPFDDLFYRTTSYEAQQAVTGGAMYADTVHPSGDLYGTSAYSILNLLRNY